MHMLSLFPVRFSAARGRRLRRPRRGSSSAARRLGAWERLGAAMDGLGHLDVEHLERRSLMAADLVLSFNDNIAANVDRSFYSPGTQVQYTLTIENKGDATATDAQVTTSLAAAITQKTWTAAYTGGATGAAIGAGDIGTKVTVPVGGKAVFTIAAAVGAAATGPLVSSAAVAAAAGEVNLSDNNATDTDRFVPASIAVSDVAGWSSTSLVRLTNPATGALVAQAFAFEPDFKTGVRTALGDLDGDGKVEVVAVPDYGRAGEIRVFRQDVAADGGVTLRRDSRYDVLPFGRQYTDGLNVAVGDFGNDGRADIAVSKAFGPGEVKIYTSTPGAASGPLTLAAAFDAFPRATGGATLAAADFGTTSGGRVTDALRRDGRAELVVGSGSGVAPVVRVYDVSTPVPAVVDTIRPLSAGFAGGLTVTTGRVNVDSTPDIIVSQGRGGASLVEAYDGRLGPATNGRLTRFAAFADLATRSAPVTTAGIDTDGDGRIDTLQVVQGGVGTAEMRRYSTSGVRQGTVTSLTGGLDVAAAAVRADRGLITTASGLQYRELVVGTGGSPSSNTATVRVNYEGWLLDGTRFDGNRDSSFGLNNVIAGWTEGLRTMKVGGRTQFIIPANLAYGGTARPGIPANSTLVFDVELLSTT